VAKYENRTGKPFTAYLPEELNERLGASAARNRRTKRAQLIIALERFLAEDEAGIDPLRAPEPAAAERPAEKPRRSAKGGGGR
jgi:hypothetical protein